MSKKAHVTMIVFSAIIVIIIGFLVLKKQTPSERIVQDESAPESTESPSMEDETPAYDSYTSDYYTRNVEPPEPNEYKPATWTTAPVQPIPSTTRIWSEKERPDISELPDTLRWNYFEPETRKQFNRKEKELLAEQGFYLEEIKPLEYIRFDDMIDEYMDLNVHEFGEDYSTVPIFITSDYLLHVYHVVFDRALQQAEERKFYFQILQLTQKLYEANEEQSRQNHQPAIRNAFVGNMAFFGVAGCLLDSAFVLSPEVQEIVSHELALVKEASGFSSSPLFNNDEDYSQYKPRGHYTKTKRLSRYFQAMMWYGRRTFYADSNDFTMMAILQSKLLMDINLGKDWNRISRAINYLIGNADDLTCKEYQQIMNKVYGVQPEWNSFSDQNKLVQFRQELSKLPGPQIGGLKGYRFLGQRFTIDARIFTNLTSPRVGSEEHPRNIPTGLDVMAILGSSTANEMVRQFDIIPHYTTNLDALKLEISSYPDNVWKKSVYMSWLKTLKVLLADKGDNYPIIFRGKLWSKKKLLTALASWSELKHDTILYSKQSGAECGEGDEEIPPLPPLPRGYIEPDLEFFNQFVDLIQTTARTFSDNQLLSDEYLQKFSLYLDRVIELRDIVRKELMNEDISKEEYKFILNFSGEICSIVIPEGSGDIIDNKFKQMALIADVHTDNQNELVLEEGVGIPQRIYIAVKDKSGGTRICVGYVYMYYEFTQPLTNRLTDDEWKANIYPTTNSWVKTKEPEWIKQMRIN